MQYFEGVWDIKPEYTENTDLAKIVYNYESKDVYLVAGSDIGAEIEIYKDGVFVQKIVIKDEQFYTVISGKDYENIHWK